MVSFGIFTIHADRHIKANKADMPISLQRKNACCNGIRRNMVRMRLRIPNMWYLKITGISIIIAKTYCNRWWKMSSIWHNSALESSGLKRVYLHKCSQWKAVNFVYGGIIHLKFLKCNETPKCTVICPTAATCP